MVSSLRASSPEAHERRPKSTAIIRTNFSAQDHGFRFGNRFELHNEFILPVAGFIDLGNIVYGSSEGQPHH